MAKMNRDNFPRKVITSLAGRVAYICSNPFCRKSTIGPNSVRDKTTLIGKAAHITAAAPGGPRYDITLTSIQRKDIDNGIWLCSNCSDLIDKDINAFTIATLKAWRTEAENYAARQLNIPRSITSSLRPKIEAALIWQRGMSSNEGLISHPGPDGIIRIEFLSLVNQQLATFLLK